jgi:uncharacterized protein (UPF0332 family)
MNPRRFLEVATRLVEQKGSGEFRSAISRAYYAVYNVAVAFLEAMEFRKASTDYHVTLQQMLLNSADPEFEKIGSDLNDLHRKRIRADYFMSDPDPEQESNALVAIQKAEQMIQSFDQLPIYSERWKNIKAAIGRVNYG